MAGPLNETDQIPPAQADDRPSMLNAIVLMRVRIDGVIRALEQTRTTQEQVDPANRLGLITAQLDRQIDEWEERRQDAIHCHARLVDECANRR